MKVYAVLRGFPGLGRVSSGIALLNSMKEHGCDVKAVSYLQGTDALSKQGIEPFANQNVSKHDIMPIGLNPIEKYASVIIEKILQDSPDLVLIDGEPLLTSTLCSVFDKNRVVSLLNPTDLVNSALPQSTINFYHSNYLSCTNSIVHGVNLSSRQWNFPGYDCKVHCLNTILRQEILNLKISGSPSNIISCVLGGGTANATERFISSTIEIGIKVAALAQENSEYQFNIYCNDKNIKDSLLKCIDHCENLQIFDEYISPEQIYSNARMVIARAGRNVSSELLYLGVPAILVATKGDFRSVEQEKNINDIIALGKGNIEKIYIDSSIDEIQNIFLSLTKNNGTGTSFIPGNDDAIKILNSIVRHV